MDRILRGASAALVVGLAASPMMEVAMIGQPNQRGFAVAILVFAATLGVYASWRRRPVYARMTTAAYGAFAFGLGLFASARPMWQLLAYAVALLGMNVLVHHVRSFGPVLASVKVEDEISRRTRAAALRSLAISGATLAVAYGGSLAILPLFALNVGGRDPLLALALAGSLVVVLLLLAVLPETPSLRRTARSRGLLAPPSQEHR